MSRAQGECWTPDGMFVGYMLYNGTIDVMLPEIWRLADDAWNHFYKDRDRTEPVSETRNECPLGTCIKKPCIVWTAYGRGFYWQGRFCPKCRRFHGPYNPYSEIDSPVRTDGHPFLQPRQGAK